MTRAAVLAAFLTVTLGAAAGAQGVSVRLGGVRATYADSITGSAAAFGIHALYETGAVRAGADLTRAWFTQDAGASTQAAASLALLRPLSARSAAGLRGAFSMNFLEGGIAAGSGNVDLFAALVAPRWLATASLAGGGVRTIDGVTHPVVAAAVSVRREVGPLAAESRAAATRSGTSSYVDLAASVEGRRGPLRLGVTVGRRWGSLAGDVFVQAHLEMDVFGQATLEAAAGSYPRDLTGFTSGRFVNVGLRLQLKTPRAISGAASRGVRMESEDGGTRVTFEVSDAAQVAIAGEWNEWRLAPLARVADGRWQIVLPLGRGAYRFSLVVDGERWVVPPGVPTMSDDFGGQVGLLVIDGG